MVLVLLGAERSQIRRCPSMETEKEENDSNNGEDTLPEYLRHSSEESIGEITDQKKGDMVPVNLLTVDDYLRNKRRLYEMCNAKERDMWDLYLKFDQLHRFKVRNKDGEMQTVLKRVKRAYFKPGALAPTIEYFQTGWLRVIKSDSTDVQPVRRRRSNSKKEPNRRIVKVKSRNMRRWG